MAFRVLHVNKLHYGLHNNINSTLSKIRQAGGLGEEIFRSSDVIIFHVNSNVDFNDRPSDILVNDFKSIGAGELGSYKQKSIFCLKKNLEKQLFLEIVPRDWNANDVSNGVVISFPDQKSVVKLGAFTLISPVFNSVNQLMITRRYEETLTNTVCAEKKCDVVFGLTEEVKIKSRQEEGEDGLKANMFAEFMERHDFFVPEYQRPVDSYELLFVKNSSKILQPCAANYTFDLPRGERLNCSLVRFIGVQGSRALEL